jgi:5-methyltetrahydrofolate--homocysteine methyltransferase
MAVHALLRNAILKGDRKAVQDIVGRETQQGADPLSLLNETMIPAIRELGDQFARGVVDMPDLLVGARAMQSGLTILEPLLLAAGHRKAGKVCIGTVKGDQHDIGKNVVATMLRARGYEVDDLGVSCGAEEFGRAVAAGSQAVLCSILMTTCLRHVKGVVRHFSGSPKIPVIVGGAAATREFADAVGAAAYGADASEAADILDRLLTHPTPSR